MLKDAPIVASCQLSVAVELNVVTVKLVGATRLTVAFVDVDVEVFPPDIATIEKE
jgi:hypothetical protein